MNVGVVSKTEYTNVPSIFFDELLYTGTYDQIRVYLAFLTSVGKDTLRDKCTSLKMTIEEVLDVLTALKKKGYLDFDYRSGDITLNYVLTSSLPSQTAPSLTLADTAEAIKGMPLSTAEFSLVYFIKDSLGFSDELVAYLLTMAAERKAFTTSYIKKVALSWADKGFTDVSDVLESDPTEQHFLEKVLRSLGRTEAPTPSEKGYVRKWMADYHMPEDVILLACDTAAIRVSKNRLLYADGILKLWHENGISSVVDAKNFAIREKEHYSSKPSDKKGGFKDFPSNTYDFEELEKQLLDN